jgi:hypothetical protein
MPLAWRRRATCRSLRRATNAIAPAADGALQAAMAYRGRCSRASHKTDSPVNCARRRRPVMNIMSYRKSGEMMAPGGTGYAVISCYVLPR